MASGADLRQAVEEIFKARVDGDIDRLMSLVDDNCEFRVVGNQHLSPMTDAIRGVDAIRAAMEQLAANWDMAGIEIESIHVDGNVAFVHRRGQMRAGPVAFDTEIMDKMTFENGKVRECVEFIDTLQTAAVLNLVQLSTAQQ